MWHSEMAACEYGREPATEAAEGGRVWQAEDADESLF